MKHLAFALAICIMAAGCGGAMYKSSYDAAYGEAPAQAGPGASGGAFESEESEVRELSSYRGDEHDYYGDMDGIPDANDDLMYEMAAGMPVTPAQKAEFKTKKKPAAKAKRSEGKMSSKYASQQKNPQNIPQAQGKETAEKQEDEAPPLVVYTGYLKLRVKRLLEAVDEVTRLTEDQGGYIESLTRDVIVVRVPAKDFDEVLGAFVKLGELLERRIKALDVTEQFTDLGTRLAVSKESRARLLLLLEKVEEVEERLLILEEIKRLSEQIESMESTLSTLQNLVDFYTITIELQPVLEDSATLVSRSPFVWVRDLSPHMTSIWDGKDEFSMDLPPAFVLFEKDDVYRAQAADTTIVRGGVVDNEPLGDNGFWSGAVNHEMIGRGEKLVDEGKAGPMAYRLYKSEDVQPRYYMVAVYSRYEDLYVVEVFYPSEEAYEAHHKSMIDSLATFEVN
jgi:hypothetical protein